MLRIHNAQSFYQARHPFFHNLNGIIFHIFSSNLFTNSTGVIISNLSVLYFRSLLSVVKKKSHFSRMALAA